MATLINTPPDKIEQTGSGQWLFTFAGGKDAYKLPFGGEFTCVYSPNRDNNHTWHATRFKVVPGERNISAYAVVKVRDLTDEEIAHFEGLIAHRGGEG